ncbi:PhzF family phenazine biosynthesis isomerase [Alkalispirochaeta sphaeroplastigenens]|uniref:PhzF family phenazine biosynthesis isomerase n=1 Tax=Alkalispirochaeta sphaeroplastigenens TaxID=1187066 RepID=UPI001FEC4A49|nr:PhzF family phenazine biosynthesis isomerase [Alkalispirochaeta sphaeroplastigenens]
MTVGLILVYIKSEDGDRRIIMTQAKIEYGKIFSEKEQEILLRGLHLNHSELDASLPVQIVSTGHSKVMIPIRKKETLDSIRINPGILTDLSQKTGCNGYYAFTFDAQEEGILASGRMFAPAIGIHEDPVTGNANGPLGAYLTRHGRIPEKRQGYTFEIKQGEAIDRKGYMRVHVYSNDEGPQVVQVSGRARIVFKTHISI